MPPLLQRLQDATRALTTTREGDSGGPAFAVHPTRASSILIGVTLGANYYGDQTDNDPANRSTTTHSRS